MRLHIVHVAVSNRGNDAHLSHIARLVHQGERRAVQADRDAAAARHLIAVTEQAEARHVGAGVDIFGASHGIARLFVERRHVGINRVAGGGGDEVCFDGGREHAAAERLGEHQHIARLRADIFEDAVGMDESRDAQAVLWLVILNGVAARDDASGLDGFGMPTLQNGANVVFRKAVRHAQKVHRHSWLAAHGVHVAQRVRRGDLAEEIRIIHNGGEEVDRLNDGDLVGDAVHGGVVTAVVAD